MFRKIRRVKNEISIEDAKSLLKSAKRGVLAMTGDNGYPYAIPINYFYDETDEKIYFHGSKIGHKVDAITNCNKVCFTVIGNPELNEESWAPYLKSAVVFGKCKIVSEDKLKKLKTFAMKYYPNEQMVDEEIYSSKASVQMFEIKIEHISGKKVQEK